MAVIATRFPGDKAGPEIIDAALTTKEAQKERGRQEINEHDSDRVIESGTIIGVDYKQPGSMVQVAGDQEVFKAKLTNFSITITAKPFSMISAIQMERIKI